MNSSCGGDASLERTFVMPSLKKRLSGLCADESGISSVEYALLLAFIGGAILVGAEELATAVENKLIDTASCIETGGAVC